MKVLKGGGSEAYMEIEVPEVTDDQRLALYEIYRVQSGETREPLETMRRQRQLQHVAVEAK